MVCFSPGGNVEWQKIGVLGYSFVTIDLNGDGWDEILTMKMAHAELAAFGLCSVTIISKLFGEWGESKTGFILAIAAIIFAICNAVFLLLVLFTFYFGRGQFTLI